MNLNQKIVDATKLSIASEVPVLMLSHPGFGKTTIIGKFATKSGMHLETLRGMDYSPEDILGYPYKTDDARMKRLLPDWYVSISDKSKEGIRSILFIDELTTAPEATQSALLSVIFDKKVCGFDLPKDIIIVAAGNYASDLSNSFNLISPVLNRFCIINLESENANDDLSLFLGLSTSTVNFDLLSVKENILENQLNKVFHEFLTNQFTNEIININKPAPNEYDNDHVRGSASPRTCFYASKLLLSIINSNYKINSPVVIDMLNGLIGSNTKSKNIGLELIEFLTSNLTLNTCSIRKDLMNPVADLLPFEEYTKTDIMSTISDYFDNKLPLKTMMTKLLASELIEYLLNSNQINRSEHGLLIFRLGSI